MADSTLIEWARHPRTGRGATWNPITGCSLVSPGCTNCYAMKLAGTRLRHHPSRQGLTVQTKAGPVWNGAIRFNEQWLTQPLQWRTPRGIFVCAHGDLFAEGVTNDMLDRIFAIMALCPKHVFFVLTKRPERMWDYLTPKHELDFSERLMRGCRQSAPLPAPFTTQLTDWITHPGHPGSEYPLSRDPEILACRKNARSFPLPNVWLGVSVEDQARADERREPFGDLASRGWTTFVSYEPAIGPVDWNGWQFLRWLISGGESGPRPSHPQWHRDARDFCAAHDIAYFFKQWGSWSPAPWKLDRLPSESDTAYIARSDAEGATHAVKRHDGFLHQMDHAPWSAARAVSEPEGWSDIRHFRNKKNSGRLLDGIEHNAFPEVAA